MKSQRRHELQTNYLADHLGTAVQTGKPYAMWAVLAVAALIVLGIGYGIYASQMHKANAAAWGDYYFNTRAGDPEVFRQVAEDHPRTMAAHWAMQTWADSQLMIGLDQAYSNRKDAEENIQRAIEAYSDVLQSTHEQELKTRAAMGLAQAYESLGKLDEASRYYQQVASGSPGVLADTARERLAWIKSGEGKSFYDWFASVRSKPASPPAIPSDLSRPPTTPDISFPPQPNPLTLPGADQSAPPTENPPAATAQPAPTPPGEQPATPPNDTPANPAPASPAPTSPAPASSGLQIEPAPQPAAPASDEAQPADEAKPPEPEAQPGSSDEQPAAPKQ